MTHSRGFTNVKGDDWGKAGKIYLHMLLAVMVCRIQPNVFVNVKFCRIGHFAQNRISSSHKCGYAFENTLEASFKAIYLGFEECVFTDPFFYPPVKFVLTLLANEKYGL